MLVATAALRATQKHQLSARVSSRVVVQGLAQCRRLKLRSLSPAMRLMFPACVVAGLLIVAVNASAAETACGSVTVVATFSSRTTLQVSSDLLQFDVISADAPATASVDFLAAARTHAGGPVVLSIEPIGQSESPMASASLSFTGDGHGLKSGTRRS